MAGDLTTVWRLVGSPNQSANRRAKNWTRRQRLHLKGGNDTSRMPSCAKRLSNPRKRPIHVEDNTNGSLHVTVPTRARRCIILHSLSNCMIARVTPPQDFCDASVVGINKRNGRFLDVLGKKNTQQVGTDAPSSANLSQLRT